MSYYEKRIAALEARIAEMARANRLKAIPVEAKLIDRIAELKAENERLRKAGDELAWAFSFAVSRHDGEPSGLVKAWHAAKEGKPTK